MSSAAAELSKMQCGSPRVLCCAHLSASLPDLCTHAWCSGGHEKGACICVCACARARARAGVRRVETFVEKEEEEAEGGGKARWADA
jgi:hypothetical protein